MPFVGVMSHFDKPNIMLLEQNAIAGLACSADCQVTMSSMVHVNKEQ